MCVMLTGNLSKWALCFHVRCYFYCNCMYLIHAIVFLRRCNSLSLLYDVCIMYVQTRFSYPQGFFLLKVDDQISSWLQSITISNTRMHSISLLYSKHWEHTIQQQKRSAFFSDFWIIHIGTLKHPSPLNTHRADLETTVGFLPCCLCIYLYV